jgi:predicted small lipoprotein YifL
MSTPRILSLLILAVALQGCGNKGPLYLPSGQSAAPPENNQSSGRK